eukprot:NODE_2347_length_952_cov_404.730212.p1 GENE.NODE_2347_length_952_cov_404.730212~~NODE_2347_length_952_cov_404.730212.p1  ORF type:complete len:252 (-),score=37.32 NODE_2347_length_952_cov_404.730212:160-915(-)
MGGGSRSCLRVSASACFGCAASKKRNMCDSDGLTVEPRRRVIVCLGQSLLEDGRVPPVLQRRVAHAAEVYRRLSREEGGACIFVTGADMAGDGTLTPEGEVMAQLLQGEHGMNAADIDKDVEAFDTIANATMAIAAIRKRGATEAVLVTSDFHAPRAAFLFKTVFNATDLVLTMDPAPSRLDAGPIRPEGVRPREINARNMLERLEHETMLMQQHMVKWLQQEGYVSNQEDFDEALAGLTRLAAESMVESQ